MWLTFLKFHSASASVCVCGWSVYRRPVCIVYLCVLVCSLKTRGQSEQRLFIYFLQMFLSIWGFQQIYSTFYFSIWIYLFFFLLFIFIFTLQYVFLLYPFIDISSNTPVQVLELVSFAYTGWIMTNVYVILSFLAWVVLLFNLMTTICCWSK